MTPLVSVSGRARRCRAGSRRSRRPHGRDGAVSIAPASPIEISTAVEHVAGVLGGDRRGIDHADAGTDHEAVALPREIRGPTLSERGILRTRRALPPPGRDDGDRAGVRHATSWLAPDPGDGARAEPGAAVPEPPTERPDVELAQSCAAQDLGVLADHHEVDQRDAPAQTQHADDLPQRRFPGGQGLRCCGWPCSRPRGRTMRRQGSDVASPVTTRTLSRSSLGLRVANRHGGRIA